MLRKFLKGCLAIAMVAAMAAPVYAGANITGMAVMTFGQSTNQSMDMVYGKDAPSVLSLGYYWEYDIIAKNEHVEIGTDVELMPPFGKPGGGPDPAWSTPYLNWMVNDSFTFRIGANTTFGKSIGFTDGVGSSAIPTIQWWGAEWAQGKGAGIHGIYKINDTLSANFGYIVDRDPIQSKAAGFMGTKKAGTGIHASVYGSFGDIGIRAAFVSSTLDDPANKDDKTASSSAMMLALKYNISDEMAVAFDYGVRSYNHLDETWTSPTPPAPPGPPVVSGSGETWANPQSGYGLQFSMKNLGPGSLTATYGMNATVPAGTDPDTIDAPATSTSLALVYGYDLAPGLALEIDYFTTTSVGKTPKGEDAPDPLTDTYVGVMFGHFFFF
jgi:hypothetical protein